uniref:Uncharacterized protein n=1 Tax=Noccaea caerulescens TaxID=107243 RepID=A0A1J3CNW6_NOCCA
MTSTREHREDNAGDDSDHRRQNHEKDLPSGTKTRIETVNSVCIQQRDNTENDKREESVNEISDSETIRRQILRRRIWPETLHGSDSIVNVTVPCSVAIGEASETTRESADNDESSGKVFVDEEAMSVVG